MPGLVVDTKVCPTAVSADGLDESSAVIGVRGQRYGVARREHSRPQHVEKVDVELAVQRRDIRGRVQLGEHLQGVVDGLYRRLRAQRLEVGQRGGQPVDE